MSLLIKEIELKNFRSYPYFHLKDIPPLTIFVGPNAIGKTNIIEGIQLLTAAMSFKKPAAEELVFWGEGRSRIRAKLGNDQRNLEICLAIEEGMKEFFLNGKRKKIKEIRGILPSVIFTPDDLSLVKGAQSGKRAAIDAVGIQLSPNYYQVKKDYEKVLVHKNHILREGGSKEVLDSMNDTLLAVGTQYFCFRQSLLGKMIPFVEGHYLNISSERESLKLVYKASWEEGYSGKGELSRKEVEEAFRRALEKNSTQEKVRKRALVGPHNDEIEFLVEGKSIRSFGSQGQQRSAVLSFKLAESSVIEEMKGQKPVLLLDDVMSELDKSRRKTLLDFIMLGSQVFITTTTLQYFPQEILDEASVIELGGQDPETR